MIDLSKYNYNTRLDIYNPMYWYTTPNAYKSEIAEIEIVNSPEKVNNRYDASYREILIKFNNPDLANEYLNRLKNDEDCLIKINNIYLLLYNIKYISPFIIDDYLFIDGDKSKKLYNHLLCEIIFKYNTILAINNKETIRDLKLRDLI